MTKPDHSEIYNDRYSSENYRNRLSGYEISRYAALSHCVPRWLGSDSVQTVLDYGSGRGLYIPLWKQLFPKAKITACDVSDVALAQLQKDHSEAQCETVLMQNDLLPKGHERLYDVIVSVEVLEHVADLATTLQDVHQALNPGGVFIWTTPCGNPWSIEHIYSSVTGQISRSSTGERRWRWEEPTHLRRLTSKEADHACRLVGFEEIEFRFRAHLFSFLFSQTPLRRLPDSVTVPMTNLDYTLFRHFPNGASMIGMARHSTGFGW